MNLSLFETNRLLDLASTTTGLADFGSDDFIEPLELLLEGYRSTADLNTLGHAGAIIYLHRMLSNRLKINAAHSQQAINNEIIHAPIVIMGLPRTGSTMLHELLDCHPDLRAPRLWESTFVPGRSPLDRIRQLITHLQVGFVDIISPGFQTVHKLGAFLPHECVTIQATAFRSMQFHAAHNVSEYNQWLNQCDWRPAYDYHKRYLQYLQVGKDQKRWVLKAPGHLLATKELIETYPDAHVICLHRDPLDVIPSMASLFHHLRRPFTNRPDLKEVGADVLEQWAIALERTTVLREIEADINARCLDIDYRTLVGNPIQVVEEILRWAKLPFDPPAKAAMEDYLRHHPQGKHGRHNYSLAQYNLNPEELSDRFAEYRSRFITG